ncbi:MAG: formate dehydrogenase accessory sulfurtransferase FdhD [Pseudomonadales bacterium]
MSTDDEIGARRLPNEGSREVPCSTWEQGDISDRVDEVIEERAVAFVYNGISHVVMMATPLDLDDLALGFSLSEGILDSPEQLLDLRVVETPEGLELHMTITARRFQALKGRRRNLTGRTGCGLCGAESLEQAMRDPTPVASFGPLEFLAFDRAIEQLRSRQPLQQSTGAAHAAAWCSRDGGLLLLREDVGRHNALDKVLGALCRSGSDRQGFMVVTSRASYEMVAKAASAGVAALVALSAPTSLAIEMASACNMTLVGFARPGRHVIYTD